MCFFFVFSLLPPLLPPRLALWALGRSSMYAMCVVCMNDSIDCESVCVLSSPPPLRRASTSDGRTNGIEALG